MKLFGYLNDNIRVLNNSKLFAGFIIIILNIASRFVTIKLSKTMESYLKFTFSRNVLIFAIAWMGTRDIYYAFTVTFLFILCFDYLFNEESMFCCFTSSFREYHISKMENNPVSSEDVKNAKSVLEKFENQQKDGSGNEMASVIKPDSFSSITGLK